MKDLVALVADKDMEMTLKGLFERPQSLGISRFSCDIFTHPQHDPGIRTSAHEFLRPYQHDYQRALVLFDREGCGTEHLSADEIAREVQNRLEDAGWRGRCAVVVIDPELEVWVFANSPHVPEVLAGGDSKTFSKIRQKYSAPGQVKPEKPKEAMEEVLRQKRIPRSSSLFQQLAQKVSLRGCTDRSFTRLREVLREWFPSSAIS